jgi:site-specific DNA-methyltransferase (adenine-specific)
MVFTASQPFTSKLVCSNEKLFRYEWIWDKKLSTGFLNAKRQPLRRHESILVFYKNLPTYNPIKTKGKLQLKCTKAKQTNNYNETKNRPAPYMSNDYYPTTLIDIPQNRIKNGHPTQKPVALFEYLIKTYTNEGDTVHDSCLGSGTTLEACKNTNRNCIGFELSNEWEPYYHKRLHLENPTLDSWDYTTTLSCGTYQQP